MRRALSLVTSGAIMAALILLATTTVVAVTAMHQSNERVAETRALASSFAEVRTGLAEEAFAEAGYRRAPSEAAWQRLEVAMAAMPDLIDAVRDDAGPVDDATLSHLSVLNGRYAHQVRQTRDQPVIPGDDRVAGPALDTMNELLTATIDRHRADITAATDRQTRLITSLRIALPIVFVFTFGVLAWALRLNGREQRRLHREAARQRARALTDPLTGLANRPALLEAIDAAEVGAVLLLVDLDRFKPVNDTWGHPVGDAVLTQVGERLRNSVPSGAVAARIGGDEFAVLTTPAGVHLLAEQLVRRLRAPYDVDGREIQLSASIGAGRLQADGGATELLRSADEALYRAKGGGRNRAEVPA